MENTFFIIKIIKPRYLLSIIFFFALMFDDSTFADENQKSIFITGIQNEQTHTMAKKVILEAYRRIGYDAHFELFPGHRSIDMANNGESDGDIARIGETQKKFTNLVLVPTSIIHFKGVVFTKTITKKINEWKDLNGLRIGVIRGIQYSTIGTQGMSPSFAEDMTHLFKLLDEDMIQVAIAVSRAGQIEISRRFKERGIHEIGEPLYTGPLYHYVHKKNRKLVPELNNILQEMERQNEIKKIVETSFKTLLRD